MLKENMNDFLFFIVLAREESFTKAAAQLGISQSALSHAIKGLETRMNIRLFNRTTRSCALTEAGERLFKMVTPRFMELEDELAQLKNEYNEPVGTIRITASDSIAETLLWPAVKRFSQKYPAIQIEINAENRLTDIVAERFDAGVRMGDQIDKDMVAVKISHEVRFAVVCSPEYLQNKAKPLHPTDLLDHECINLRLNSLGGNYAWEFSKDDKAVNVRVKGRFTFNTTRQLLTAALDGFGFAYLSDTLVEPYLKTGQLIRVLEDWCPPQPPFYLYYPSRHQHREAFRLFMEELRYDH